MIPECASGLLTPKQSRIAVDHVLRIANRVAKTVATRCAARQ